jgi:hypothetical protein
MLSATSTRAFFEASSTVITTHSPTEYVFLSNIGKYSTEYTAETLKIAKIPIAKSGFSANPICYYKKRR